MPHGNANLPGVDLSDLKMPSWVYDLRIVREHVKGLVEEKRNLIEQTPYLLDLILENIFGEKFGFSVSDYDYDDESFSLDLDLTGDKTDPVFGVGLTFDKSYTSIIIQCGLDGVSLSSLNCTATELGQSLLYEHDTGAIYMKLWKDEKKKTIAHEEMSFDSFDDPGFVQLNFYWTFESSGRETCWGVWKAESRKYGIGWFKQKLEVAKKIEKAIYSKQQDIDYQKELAERMKSSFPDSSSSSNADAVKMLSKIVDELLEEKLRSRKLPDSDSDFKFKLRPIEGWEHGQEPTVRMKIHHYQTVIETLLRKLALDVLKNEPNWKKELIPKDIRIHANEQMENKSKRGRVLPPDEAFLNATDFGQLVEIIGKNWKKLFKDALDDQYGTILPSLKELKDRYRDPISHADATMEYNEMDVEKVMLLLYEIQTRTTKFYGK